MSTFEKRIEILSEFRSKGRQALSEFPKLKCAVRNEFRRSMIKAYRDRLVHQLDESEEGIGIDTARRLLGDGKSLEFANWLSIAFVFKLAWKDLEVDSRRRVVIDAMLDALSVIRAELESCSGTLSIAVETVADGSERPRLTRQQWECLRRIHLSEPWLEATKIAEDRKRRTKLLRIADTILEKFRAELTRDEVECEITEPAALLSLVGEWHAAWTAFFGAVTCRWRF